MKTLLSTTMLVLCGSMSLALELNPGVDLPGTPPPPNDDGSITVPVDSITTEPTPEPEPEPEPTPEPEVEKNDPMCEGYNYFVLHSWTINASGSKGNPVTVGRCMNDIPENHLGVMNVINGIPHKKIIDQTVPYPSNWNDMTVFNTNNVENYPSTYVKNYNVKSEITVAPLEPVSDLSAPMDVLAYVDAYIASQK
ncbi:MAG: hypothetical protein N0C84_00515 [Candidatus Thiodiazotropha taylori]|uniref:Uncharacterized protein n=1 Tax=Candidatus Thiodiazotropha taylori TaxID=2792791 RepID=A0A9E4K9D9_9GAMM|nr:hypothetical protein [Candidatus Thiodiazotropha taylori]MCW4254927.1 hypothetical protein [Candidatus Thiodiazotropha taylori]